ncbi:PREDICTED: CASP-like protein 1F1 isoform X2 [Nicotiana attenuata]|uniref:CASP-like protein 1F1 isoform X2 n=1 Tax=Nicotiana attenuata TaxID=49451 RepID=UPI000905B3B4|nr:PREDICTED: CASP-like protein 1F1 isoform X2 [Nicotiana attenuata]
MECFGTNATHNQPLKSHKYFLGAQILLRILGIIFTLAATWTILTSKHTTVSVFDIQINANISYPPSLKFFAYANIIGCGFSVLSLCIAFILGHKVLDPKNFIYMFIHDLQHQLDLWGNMELGRLGGCPFVIMFPNSVTELQIVSCSPTWAFSSTSAFLSSLQIDLDIFKFEKQLGAIYSKKFHSASIYH